MADDWTEGKDGLDANPSDGPSGVPSGPIDDGESTPLGDDALFLHWLGEHQANDPMFEKLMTTLGWLDKNVPIHWPFDFEIDYTPPEPVADGGGEEVSTAPPTAAPVEVRVRIDGPGLDQLVSSYQHVNDHGCPAGSEYLMGVIAAIIESASEQLFRDSDEV